jgi:alcohol dehydrogenase class IV
VSVTGIKQFFMTTRLLMGQGCLNLLADEIRKTEAEKVLVVTDKGIVRAGILEAVQKILEQCGIPYFVYEEVEPNPDIIGTDRGYDRIKEQKFDLVLAVGGGSVIDCAKALSILLTNGGSIADYFGREQYKNSSVPLFVVPTTVGTGSEVTRACVITDHETHVKKVVGGVSLAPKLAFLDAALLGNLPSQLVAATGMDALTHAIEGYVSTNATPITDALNLHAIRIIAANIRPAVADSGNAEAIGSMLVASTTTGIGFGNSLLGMVHSISHAVGGQYNAPHGILNAILLPYVLEFNWIGNPAKFSHIAEAFRIDIRGITVEDAAKAAVQYVKTLCREVGIPEKLSAIGVDDSKLELLTDMAFNDIYIPTNPRKPKREEVYRIIQSAI